MPQLDMRRNVKEMGAWFLKKQGGRGLFKPLSQWGKAKCQGENL